MKLLNELSQIRGMPQPKASEVRFKGGMDLVSLPMNTKPGTLSDCRNFEISVNGDYVFIEGYERYDGHASPSSATYIVLAVTISGSFAVGNTVTGNTSGATGKVIVVGSSGSLHWIVLTRTTGSFIETELLKVGGSTQGTYIASSYTFMTVLLDATYLNLAADEYRTSISAVTGEGSILGVFRFNGVTYAFRNNVGSTAAALYKSTASGWSLISLGRELSFTSGGLERATGTVTLTGGAAGSVNGITVNGVQIMSGAVAYATSLTVTATAVAANINAFSSTPEYTAIAVGAVITITSTTGGAAVNGFVVTATLTTITATYANMSGGVDGTAIAEGVTITGGTSGATAVVTRVSLESGTWEGGDAAGRLIFASQTGNFTAEKLTAGATANLATIAGNSTAITLSANGRFKTYIHNFSGALSTRRVYGCDGVNRGWEFDPVTAVFAPIATGMSTSLYGDRPSNVIAHKNQLFFSFGPSVQNSSIQNPFDWEPILGAGEIALGDNVTGFSIQMGAQAGASLAIFSRNSTSVLYGDDTDNYQLIKLRDEAGAYENSIQSMGQALYMDDQGWMGMQTTLDFGNFSYSSKSTLIRPFINTRKSTIKDSCIVRGKSQYRAFFDDKSVMSATMVGDKLMGLMTSYLDHKVTCMCSVEESDGSDGIFFGSTDGFVYQMDKGTSFDGGAIEYSIILHFMDLNAPGLIKAWKSMALELTGDGYAAFSFGYQLGYNSSLIVQPNYQTGAESFTPSHWDEFTWDDAWWDGATVSPQRFKLNSSSTNIAFAIYANSDMLKPVSFGGGVFRYIPRRYQR